MKQLMTLAGVLFLAGCQSACMRSQAESAPAGLLEGIASGRTRVVDLSHALNSKTPYWPGEGNRPFKYEYFTSLEKDHVLEGHFSIDEHTGTHFDAPNHFVTGQLSVDKIPAARMFVPVIVIDVRSKTSGNADYFLTTAGVDNWVKAHGRVPSNAMVMMYTGWETRWKDFARYKNADRKGVLHFPGFSPEAAKFLVVQRNIAGLGIDALSIDYGKSEDFPSHLISHGSGKFNLENVANLGDLPPVGAFLIVAPN
jgi:kynurenine formamidase